MNARGRFSVRFRVTVYARSWVRVRVRAGAKARDRLVLGLG